MLESLLNFREINRRPYLAFGWAFIILSISFIIALRIGFKVAVGASTVNLTGIFALAFALISSSYFMTALIRKEELMEEKAIIRHYSRGFWPRHQKDILIFLWFFGGATLAFAVFAMALPADTFQVQLSSICAMRPELGACDSPVTGGITAAAASGERFQPILLNNLEVGAFSFILAFVFGAGSAFIILWNAGILGIYIGLISRHIFELPVVSLKFLPHGIPEIAGYICAGLAGTLISTAIIRRAGGSVLRPVVLDSLKVLGLGIALIVFGAFIEAFL